jgi:hypothetical protein
MKLHATLALAAVFATIPAQAQDTEELRSFAAGLDSFWEVMWHQSGTPTQLVRWQEGLRVHVSGVEVDRHRDVALKALREVAAESGKGLVEVATAAEANVVIQIVSDQALSDYQPCETYLEWNVNDILKKATVQMRSSDVERCSYHESMHVMGLRGHPAGSTVLSYFHDEASGLMPLDRAFLRAWYSKEVQPGMGPFEVLPAMANQLACQMGDMERAAKIRDEFFVQTYMDARAYAAAKGDVPAIVKRSGKATAEGIRNGREAMSYFLPAAAHLPLFSKLQCKSAVTHSTTTAKGTDRQQLARVRHKERTDGSQEGNRPRE